MKRGRTFAFFIAIACLVLMIGTPLFQIFPSVYYWLRPFSACSKQDVTLILSLFAMLTFAATSAGWAGSNLLLGIVYLLSLPFLLFLYGIMACAIGIRP